MATNNETDFWLLTIRGGASQEYWHTVWAGNLAQHAYRHPFRVIMFATPIAEQAYYQLHKRYFPEIGDAQ